MPVSSYVNSEGRRTLKIEAGNWLAVIVNKAETYVMFSWRVDDEFHCFALRTQYTPPVWWAPTVLNDCDVNPREVGAPRILRRIGLGWLIFTVEAIWTLSCR